MYAGTTISRGSGKIVGVHQKIDRAARRHIKKYLPKTSEFPTIKQILHFEGNNGPDGIKRKGSTEDDPWYFIDPNNPDDKVLLTTVNNHIINLSVALKNKNHIRAAFESAWLSHVIVDGLTPAHHYPLSDKIEELWGKAHTERDTIKDKNIIHGDGIRDTISKNWEYWGVGGVFTTHGMFEMGVATAIAPLNFKESILDRKDIIFLKRNSFEEVFLKSLQKINELKMYDNFGKKGWTQGLAKQTKNILVPEMIKVVTLAWYDAVIKSEESKK
ncbi:MAG: hypothetical protein WCK26_01950 [Candidatus Saccharibacteria bacterium]